MIDISNTAQDYFRRLIGQQDEPGLALRIRVVDAGTPQADCDLQFWPASEQDENDHRETFEGFDLFIEPASRDWLREAEIDFETEGTGGQLTIRAPRIKGTVPDEDAPLSDRVRWVLDTEVNPNLAAHGGRVRLVDITEKNEVVLEFGGGCHGCGMVSVTLREGIEKTLSGHFPDITGILDATDHDTGENPYYAG